MNLIFKEVYSNEDLMITIRHAAVQWKRKNVYDSKGRGGIAHVILLSHNFAQRKY
jgi:hypothetical protein